MLKPIINCFLISIRLLPLFYFLTLGLAKVAISISEQVFDIYALTFRPFIYALLMLSVLWALSLHKLDWFNKYLWYWVKGYKPHQVIYLWLSLITGTFGLVCLLAGLSTVLIGADSTFSMFMIRDHIFYPFIAAFLVSPLVITLHLHLKTHKP